MVAYLTENGKEFSVIKTHGVSVLEEFPLEGNDEKRVLSAKLFVLTFDSKHKSSGEILCGAASKNGSISVGSSG